MRKKAEVLIYPKKAEKI